MLGKLCLLSPCKSTFAEGTRDRPRSSTQADVLVARSYPTDKAAFVLVALNYAAGGLGNYRIGLTGPAFAFAGSLVPMLASLSD